MKIKNKGKNTINISLNKFYEGFGRTLIMIRNEVKDIPQDMLKEPEIKKYISKGIVIELKENEIIKTVANKPVVSDKHEDDKKDKKSKKNEEVSNG